MVNFIPGAHIICPILQYGQGCPFPSNLDEGPACICKAQHLFYLPYCFQVGFSHGPDQQQMMVSLFPGSAALTGTLGWAKPKWSLIPCTFPPMSIGWNGRTKCTLPATFACKDSSGSLCKDVGVIPELSVWSSLAAEVGPDSVSKWDAHEAQLEEHGSLKKWELLLRTLIFSTSGETYGGWILPSIIVDPCNPSNICDRCQWERKWALCQ